MDPNKTLKQLREAIRRMNQEWGTIGATPETVDQVVLLFDTLDEWMSKGGFPPTDWDHPYGDKAREEDRMRREV